MTKRRHLATTAKSPLRSFRWPAFLGKILLCLALVLAPWPGIASAWSEFFCSVGTSLVAPLLSGDDAGFLYKPKDLEASPWQVKVYFGELSTRHTAEYSVDARSSYISLASYLALALATLWQRQRGKRIVFVGLPALVTVLLINQFLFATLSLSELGWRPLPGAMRVALQVPFTTFNSLLGLTFAVPGALWWLCLDRSVRESPLGLMNATTSVARALGKADAAGPEKAKAMKQSGPNKTQKTVT